MTSNGTSHAILIKKEGGGDSPRNFHRNFHGPAPEPINGDDTPTPPPSPDSTNEPQQNGVISYVEMNGSVHVPPKPIDQPNHLHHNHQPQQYSQEPVGYRIDHVKPSRNPPEQQRNRHSASTFDSYHRGYDQRRNSEPNGHRYDDQWILPDTRHQPPPFDQHPQSQQPKLSHSGPNFDNRSARDTSNYDRSRDHSNEYTRSRDHIKHVKSRDETIDHSSRTSGNGSPPISRYSVGQAACVKLERVTDEIDDASHDPSTHDAPHRIQAGTAEKYPRRDPSFEFPRADRYQSARPRSNRYIKNEKPNEEIGNQRKFVTPSPHSLVN